MRELAIGAARRDGALAGILFDLVNQKADVLAIAIIIDFSVFNKRRYGHKRDAVNTASEFFSGHDSFSFLSMRFAFQML